MIKTLKACLAGLLCVLAITGCQTVKRQPYDYSEYRQARPRSVLVLPPVNQTTDVKATYSVLSFMTGPLAESGYYVMPVTLVDETFRQNGIAHANEMQAVPLEKLNEIFNADAVLYTNISEFGSTYRVVSAATTVRLSAKLVDVHTGKTIWSGSAFASDDNGQPAGGGGILGVLIAAAVKQIINNLSDSSAAVADSASIRLLSAGQPNGLLYGPYSPKYKTD